MILGTLLNNSWHSSGASLGRASSRSLRASCVHCLGPEATNATEWMEATPCQMASRPENFPKGVLFININTDIRVRTEGKTRFAVPTSYQLIWEHLNSHRESCWASPLLPLATCCSNLRIFLLRLKSASELAARVQRHAGALLQAALQPGTTLQQRLEQVQHWGVWGSASHLCWAACSSLSSGWNLRRRSSFYSELQLFLQRVCDWLAAETSSQAAQRGAAGAQPHAHPQERCPGLFCAGAEWTGDENYSRLTGQQ